MSEQGALELLARYRKALESLVPMGSEFVNEPENCARFVSRRLRTSVKIAIERNEWRARAEAAEGALAEMNA